jgi:hypothetical protein
MAMAQNVVCVTERANVGRTKVRAAIRLADIEETPDRKRVIVNRGVQPGCNVSLLNSRARLTFRRSVDGHLTDRRLS